MPRLDLLIAYNSGLSRRQVTRLFRAGKITDPSGQQLDDPRVRIAPSDLPREVAIDDAPLTLRTRFDLIQHKPTGVVTALRDGRHQTAYELLRDVPLHRHLRAVGRLDLDTSGLLLWTTDGDLVHRATHPRYAVPRAYQAALECEFVAPEGDLQLDDGHVPNIVALERLERAQLHPALQVTPEASAFAGITITGGKFHEVRRIFAALGTKVVGLCRVAYGPLSLPADLPPGAHAPADLHAAFVGMHPEPRT